MYKRLLTLTFVLVVFLTAIMNAQAPGKVFHGNVKKSMGEVTLSKVLNTQLEPVDYLKAITGDVIGYSYYDYQTNGAIGQKIIRGRDNTTMVGIMASWTNTGTGQSGARGSYYQFHNGTQWLDTTNKWRRIEANRRGWTQIRAFSDFTAVILSHVAAEININNATPENPSWSSQIVPGTADLSWPKLALDNAGDGTLYITGGESNGLPVPLVRSTDGGGTWLAPQQLIDTPNVLFPDYVSIAADDAAIDADSAGTVVALVTFATGGNVHLFKSTDRGATFTNMPIFDALKSDTTLDRFPFDSSFFPQKTYKMLGFGGYSDGSGDVMVDNQGVIHVAWGSRELGYVVRRDSATGKLTRTFFTAKVSQMGIYYWNSTMTEPVIAAAPGADNYDPDNWIVYNGEYPSESIMDGVDGAIFTMPQIGKNDQGHIFLVWQGFKKGDIADIDPDATGIEMEAYGHVFATKSTNNGQSFGPYEDLFNTTGEDVIFPAMADYVDQNIHLVVQNDQTPGSWLNSPPHPQNKNAYVYRAFSSPAVNVNDKSVKSLTYKLDQNYPNPFNPSTRINFTLAERSNVTLKVYDMLGREVATLIDGVQNAGEHTADFNAASLASGMYIYTLKANNFTSTRKMLFVK